MSSSSEKDSKEQAEDNSIDNKKGNFRSILKTIKEDFDISEDKKEISVPSIESSESYDNSKSEFSDSANEETLKIFEKMMV